MFPGGIVVHIANAENRVQNPKMIRSGFIHDFPFFIHDFPFFSPATFCRVFFCFPIIGGKT